MSGKVEKVKKGVIFGFTHVKIETGKPSSEK
jgi:hypothetical protein